MKLHLADNLALPSDEAVSQKYAFIGRSGSGKTYAAMKLAELFLTAEAQVIVLDWVGNWWALRLGADGKSPGFEHVYIFGGEHADVPLEATGGAMMADLLVDKHISAVLDLSPFRKGERTRFATAFAEQLFHRKKTARTACHLFLEEAQAFLPQMVRGDDARMVGVFEDIGKVGRNYGIGVSILSQRPQAVNKDVLNQTEVLLAFQTNGPQERKTIGGWVVEHGNADVALVNALPTLPRGDAFVWSPQWLQIQRRVHVLARVTYDASSTPTQRAKQVKPKALTPADIQTLGEAMKATVERARADDPRELRKTIAEQRRELGLLKAELARGAQKQPPTIERVEVPVVNEAELTRLADATHELHAAVCGITNDLGKQTAAVCGAVQELTRTVHPIVARHAITPRKADPRRESQPVRVDRTVSRRGEAERVANGTGDISVPAQRILNALAWWDSAGVPQPTRHQTAFVARYSVNGHFNNQLGGLRTNGLVEYPAGNCVSLTDAGRAVAAAPEDAPSRDELIQRVRAILRQEPQRRLFDALVDAGAVISRDDLANACRYSVNGHFNNMLGSLRSLGVVAYPRGNHVGLSELFEAVR